jgi:hypothetical protein
MIMLMHFLRHCRDRGLRDAQAAAVMVPASDVLKNSIGEASLSVCRCSDSLSNVVESGSVPIFNVDFFERIFELDSVWAGRYTLRHDRIVQSSTARRGRIAISGFGDRGRAEATVGIGACSHDEGTILGSMRFSRALRRLLRRYWASRHCTRRASVVRAGPIAVSDYFGRPLYPCAIIWIE